MANKAKFSVTIYSLPIRFCKIEQYKSNFGESRGNRNQNFYHELFVHFFAVQQCLYNN